MNKVELLETISNLTGFSKTDTEKTLDAFIDTIVKEVSKGNEVSIAGLGKFLQVKRAAKTGINPITKESIQIDAKKAPKFKAAKAFKDTVNK